MNQNVLKSVELLNERLKEFSKSIQKYINEFNKETTTPHMLYKYMDKGYYKLNLMNIEMEVTLEDVLSDKKDESDGMDEKVYDYLDNLIMKKVDDILCAAGKENEMIDSSCISSKNVEI